MFLYYWGEGIAAIVTTGNTNINTHGPIILINDFVE
jgi:hypothetical protein